MRTLQLVAAIMLIASRAALAEKPPLVDWPRQTMAELISLVPQADQELYWDEATKNFIEHPAATEVRRRIKLSQLTDEDWQQLLIKTRVIRTHAKWPANTTYAVRLTCPTWLGRSGSVSVTPRLGDATMAKTTSTWGGCSLGNDAKRDERTYMKIGRLAHDTREVVFDVEAAATEYGEDLQATWRGSISLAVETVPSEKDAIDGVHNDALTTALRNALFAEVGPNSGQPPTTKLWLNCRPDALKVAFKPKVSCSLSIDIIDTNWVIDHAAMTVDPDECGPGAYINVAITDLPTARPEAQAMLDRLTIHITGNTEKAFRDLAHEKYWNGDITIPLKDILNKPLAAPTPIPAPNSPTTQPKN